MVHNISVLSLQYHSHKKAKLPKKSVLHKWEPRLIMVEREEDKYFRKTTWTIFHPLGRKKYALCSSICHSLVTLFFFSYDSISSSYINYVYQTNLLLDHMIFSVVFRGVECTKLDAHATFLLWHCTVAFTILRNLINLLVPLEQSLSGFLIMIWKY